MKTKIINGLGYSYTAVKNEDGEWVCVHPNVEIEPPCCSSPEPDTGYYACGCGGQYQVYCPDCKNDDMTDRQIEQILDGTYES